MGFRFKQPLVGEKRCVTTLITAAKETTLGPAMIRTVCRLLSQVSYFSSETRSLTSKKLYAFLESLCFWSSMYRFVPPLIVLVPQDLYSSLRASLLTVLRVVYAIVRLSSGKTVVSILHVDLISCRYF